VRTTLLALALALVACGRSDRSHTPAAASAPAAPPPSSAGPSHGPDQLALRVPRRGGPVRAFSYPTLDSVVWSSKDPAPALERFLGFDDEAGSVTGVDTRGAIVRIDLHLGTVSREVRPKLTGIGSVDGSTVYGIGSEGSVSRLTPSGTWTFQPPSPAREVIPEPDGSIFILADRNGGTVIWHMYPPDRTITDTARFPRVRDASPTAVGDRLYFVIDSGLVGVQSRGLTRVSRIELEDGVRALATTPSGDRIYAALDSTRQIVVIDRYAQRVRARIAIPGLVSELRMDPMGRLLFARAARGDSAWVIALATDRLVGSVLTAWRSDLPAVAPNGWLALARGGDVVLVNDRLALERRVPGGAGESWLFISWNGFRPRPAGLDEPVTFDYDTARTDSAALDTGNVFAGETPLAGTDTGAVQGGRGVDLDTLGRAPAAPPRRDTTTAPGAGFTVQFAALRAWDVANALAQEIVIRGEHPHVVTTVRAGVPIYRVVLGPFATRAEAEEVGRLSGRSYWIYQGAP
jgi:hypothetical protein